MSSFRRFCYATSLFVASYTVLPQMPQSGAWKVFVLHANIGLLSGIQLPHVLESMRETAWSPAPPGRTSIQSTASTSLNRHSTSQLPQLSQPPLYSQEHLSTSQPLICLQCPHSVLVLLCRSTVSSSYLSGNFPTTRTCSNQPSCHLQTGSARPP